MAPLYVTYRAIASATNMLWTWLCRQQGVSMVDLSIPSCNIHAKPDGQESLLTHLLLFCALLPVLSGPFSCICRCCIRPKNLTNGNASRHSSSSDVLPNCWPSQAPPLVAAVESPGFACWKAHRRQLSSNGQQFWLHWAGVHRNSESVSKYAVAVSGFRLEGDCADDGWPELG